MMLAVIAWQSIVTRTAWAAALIAAAYYITKQGWLTLDNIERVGKVLDTPGGKILVLVILTIIFFSSAVGCGYYVMEALEAHTLTPDNALVNLLIQFLTGTAFGTAMGALINLLGGQKEPGK